RLRETLGLDAGGVGEHFGFGDLRLRQSSYLVCLGFGLTGLLYDFGLRETGHLRRLGLTEGSGLQPELLGLGDGLDAVALRFRRPLDGSDQLLLFAGDLLLLQLRLLDLLYNLHLDRLLFDGLLRLIPLQVVSQVGFGLLLVYRSRVVLYL